MTQKEDKISTEARCYTSGFEDGGRVHKPRDAGKGNGTDLPLEPLEGV